MERSEKKKEEQQVVEDGRVDKEEDVSEGHVTEELLSAEASEMKFECDKTEEVFSEHLENSPGKHERSTPDGILPTITIDPANDDDNDEVFIADERGRF